MNSEDNIDLEESGPAKNWLDTFSWYLLVMGFIAILVSGLCFFLFRNKPLTYDDFSIDANTLGKYLLVFGLVLYVVGRSIHYTRKLRNRR